MCDFLPFAQFKTWKKPNGRVLLLVKLQTEACNFIKSNTPSWVFHVFLIVRMAQNHANHRDWSYYLRHRIVNMQFSDQHFSLSLRRFHETSFTLSLEQARLLTSLREVLLADISADMFAIFWVAAMFVLLVLAAIFVLLVLAERMLSVSSSIFPSSSGSSSNSLSDQSDSSYPPSQVIVKSCRLFAGLIGEGDKLGESCNGNNF